jgi:hypothetical protein
MGHSHTTDCQLLLKHQQQVPGFSPCLYCTCKPGHTLPTSRIALDSPATGYSSVRSHWGTCTSCRHRHSPCRHHQQGRAMTHRLADSIPGHLLLHRYHHLLCLLAPALRPLHPSLPAATGTLQLIPCHQTALSALLSPLLLSLRWRHPDCLQPVPNATKNNVNEGSVLCCQQ